MMLKISKWVNSEKSFQNLRKTFSDLSLEEKLEILKNTDDIILDYSEELFFLASVEPKLLISLKKSKWFIEQSFNLLKNAVIENDMNKFKKIFETLGEIYLPHEMESVIIFENENLLSLSKELHQTEFEKRLNEFPLSVKLEDYPVQFKTTEQCRQYLTSMIESVESDFDNILKYSFENVRKAIRLGLNLAGSQDEKLNFLTYNNLELFNYFYKYNPENISFFIDAIANTKIDPSSFEALVKILNQLSIKN